MDCGHFDQLLDALLEGRCAPGEWSHAREHMRECPRCRQLFEALSGRADTLGEAGHAALTAAIVARTSGNTCAAARDRLCDFVDGTLGALDRDLVEGHTAGCPACRDLAGALARVTAVLPSFVEIEPPAALAGRVLAATSRRAAVPSMADQVAAWLARAAMRPRFSVSVAYVATLLIVLAVGDPVSAFRRTMDRGAEYVQPAVVAVGQQVVARVGSARELSAETLGEVATLTDRPGDVAKGWDAGLSAVRQWLASALGAPLASMIERMSQWIGEAMDALIRLVRPEPPGRTTPAPAAAPRAPEKAPARTEPFRQPLRLS